MTRGVQRYDPLNRRPAVNRFNHGNSRNMDYAPKTELTPLNAKRSQILREVYNSDLLEMPPPGKGLRGPFKDRWCEFHRLKGHDTEECWDLMNQIEHLIKDGYLKRYVAGKNHSDYAR
ncbi:hypothetical protein SESBI_32883 [Sesbania bispinosa]|nr:hypothetical protein SESBI_32883 [Sesbania bispinosa]